MVKLLVEQESLWVKPLAQSVPLATGRVGLCCDRSKQAFFANALAAVNLTFLAEIALAAEIPLPIPKSLISCADTASKQTYLHPSDSVCSDEWPRMASATALPPSDPIRFCLQ